MKSVALALGALASCAMLEAPAAAHPLFSKCPPDSARVGTTCIDKYEASGQQSLGLGGPLPGMRWWLVTPTPAADDSRERCGLPAPPTH